MTLSEILSELAHTQCRLDILAAEVKPRADMQNPNDSMQATWNSIGGANSAIRAARYHLQMAIAEGKTQCQLITQS